VLIEVVLFNDADVSVIEGGRPAYSENSEIDMNAYLERITAPKSWTSCLTFGGVLEVFRVVRSWLAYAVRR
jgi:hypothetical protein